MIKILANEDLIFLTAFDKLNFQKVIDNMMTKSDLEDIFNYK